MLKTNLFLLLISFFIFSCQTKTFDNKEELLKYLKSNQKFSQGRSLNGIDFKLTYKPTDLIAYQDGQFLDSLKSTYQDNIYFVLSLSSNGKELLSAVPRTKDQHSALSQKLSFGMTDHFILYNTSDTLELIDYVFERTYGMSEKNDLLLSFSGREKLTNEFLTLTVRDFGLGTGDVSFKWNEKYLVNEPKLKSK